MQPHRILLRVAIGMLASLSFAAQAHADALSLSHTNIRAVWSSFTLRGGGIEVRCPVTLEGSFHSSTVVKAIGLLVGFINRGSLSRERCTGAEAVALLTETLPWHVSFDSFSGTLPLITGVKLRLIGAAMLSRVFGLSCLYRSTTSRPFLSTTTISSGSITGLSMDESASVPLSSGAFCPASVVSSGTGVVSQAGTTNTVRIALLAGPYPLRAQPIEYDFEPGRTSKDFLFTATTAVTVSAIRFRTENGEYVYNAETDCVKAFAPGDLCDITVRSTVGTPAANTLRLMQTDDVKAGIANLK